MANTNNNDNKIDMSYTRERKEAARKAMNVKDSKDKNDDTERDSKSQEIIVFVYLAIAVFLLCSNFGLCGPIGRFFSNIMFGLFGTVSFVLPVYVFLSAAFFLSNGAQKKLVKRVLCVGLFIIALAFIFQLGNGTKGATIASLYKDGARLQSGGGVILGGLLVLLDKLLGTAGSIIVILLISAIGVITVMDVSLLDMFKSGVDKKREKKKQAKLMREEDMQNEPVHKENPNKHKDMLRSNEVLINEPADTKEKSKKENEIVKSEEIHEIKAKPLDYFNITSDMSRYNPDDYKYQPKETYSENFFTKTDFLGSGVYQNPQAESVAQKEQKPIVSDLYAQKSNEFDFNPFANLDFDNESSRYAPKPEEKENNISGATEKEDILSKENIIPVEDIVPEEDIIPKEDILPKENIVSKEESVHNTNSVSKANVQKKPTAAANDGYKFPTVDLLNAAKQKSRGGNEAEVAETAQRLKSTLENFGVHVTVSDYSRGPSVTRYELLPEQGVKVSKILGLADDIKLNLAAADIRIEAPIPGKAAIGIEVPNAEKDPVYFRELLESEEYKKFPSKLAFAVGKDIGGKVIVTDVAKMPHLLIAGATGSGKSVCVNSLIMSILYKAHPKDVKFIMVDPKKVELNMYNGIPHMLIPVVTDPKKATGALNWAVMEMTNRYQSFAQYNVRNIQGYNDKVKVVTGSEDGNEDMKPLSQIVIVIDELADLMMVAGREVEDAIVRLTQLARAAGIHLIIATQRPSVDVITGLIKANVPSRIAMTVASGTDSRTIIDQTGAEKLLGKGDMLFYPTGYPKPVRVQGAYLTDEELETVCDFIKNQNIGDGYDESVSAQIADSSALNTTSAGAGEPAVDDYFADAGRFIIGKDKASIGMLQRVYKIGFNRAARIMDQLSDAGVVGPEEGTKPRKVLMTLEEFENYCEEHL